MREIQPQPPVDHRDTGQIQRDNDRAWREQLERDRKAGTPYYFICRCIYCGKSHEYKEEICKGCGKPLNFLSKENQR